MKGNLVRSVVAAVAALGALTGTAAWAGTTGAAEISLAGATTVVYRGSRVQVAVSCRYARYHPEGKWLMLDTEMTAFGGPIQIPRTAIAVRTPSGEVVPLATQQEFEQGYPELASPIRQANFLREPLGYFLHEPFRKLHLFRVHGVGWVWPYVLLDPFHNCYGRLYFRLPAGVQKGRYELLIQVPRNGEAVIPFTV
jgi:hypothetical protein